MNPLFLPLILLLPSYITSQPDFLLKVCSNDVGNYTAGSTYRTNLNNLLTSFASDNRSTSGFYNSSSGQGPERVNGIGLCRGDVAPADCRGCITNATRRILQDCPNQKQVVGWYDSCMIRYSNRSIFQTPDTEDNYYLWNLNNVSDPKPFNDALVTLLDRLRFAAASSGKKFATGTQSEGLKTIYGLVQCTPDLSGQLCDDCLFQIINQVPDCCARRIGGRVINPSCNFRYEISQFYAETMQAPPPAMSLPPSLPPVSSPPLLPVSFPPPSPNGNRGTKNTAGWIIAIVVAIISFIFFLFLY